jgi:trans-aconitate methyltransferase
MNTQTSYDAVADEYATRIADELKDKPLDRQLLDRFAANMSGPVCDVGCGPGHVTRYLHDRGADVFGIDLSPGMLAQARRLNPDIRFEVGDMQALTLADASVAGITAFYSLIHISRANMVSVLHELKRVLQPNGLLFMAFHIGDETSHLQEWWGHTVEVDFHDFQPAEMEGYLSSAGFTLEETIVRPPYPKVEHQSHRAYIFARKPM